MKLSLPPALFPTKRKILILHAPHPSGSIKPANNACAHSIKTCIRYGIIRAEVFQHYVEYIGINRHSIFVVFVLPFAFETVHGKCKFSFFFTRKIDLAGYTSIAS
jgi:hypothetical protein